MTTGDTRGTGLAVDCYDDRRPPPPDTRGTGLKVDCYDDRRPQPLDTHGTTTDEGLFARDDLLDFRTLKPQPNS